MKNPNVDTSSKDSNSGPHNCKADALPHDHEHHKDFFYHVTAKFQQYWDTPLQILFILDQNDFLALGTELDLLKNICSLSHITIVLVEPMWVGGQVCQELE